MNKCLLFFPGKYHQILSLGLRLYEPTKNFYIPISKERSELIVLELDYIVNFSLHQNVLLILLVCSEMHRSKLLGYYESFSRRKSNFVLDKNIFSIYGHEYKK